MLTFFEYVKLIENDQISGEYWIDETGSSVYADADIGDVSHEGYVMNLVQHHIVDHFGYLQFDQGEYVDFEGFKKKLVADIVEEKDLDPMEIDDDEVFQDALKEEGITEEQIDIAEGGGDARVYAMKNMGWKAIRGHHVESWTLTPHDMQVIARGIEDILEGEGDIDTPDEELEFVVSAYQRSPVTMTLAELKVGRPSFLNIGATKTQQMQQTLSKQATQQTKELERQHMSPYYREKEEERERRYLGAKSATPSSPHPWSVAAKPGQKWWAQQSEGTHIYKW
jgi:hypothetical protein